MMTGSTSARVSHLGEAVFRAALRGVNLVANRPVIYLLLASLVYFAETYRIAAATPFHGDEFFTLFNSRMPTIQQTWAALSSGLEITPPTIHLGTKLVERWFGPGQFTSRLPSIVGFWCMLFCTYWFVRRRAQPVYAAIASIFPVFTAAYAESCQTRPYGLVLAGCGLALVCWQRAAEGGRRLGMLLGLTFAVALAISSHYYGVLLLLPLAAGELQRWIVRRRPDWPVWTAIVAGLLPLLLFLPLIRGAWPRTGLWSPPFSFFSVLVIYRTIIHPMLLMLLLVLLVVAVFRRSGTANDRTVWGVPGHELAAVVVLALLPFLLFLSAALVTKAFWWHYAISFVVGLAILFGFSASAATSDQPVLASLLFLAMLVLVLGGVYKRSAAENLRWNPVMASRSPLFSSRPQLPLVVASAPAFLGLHFYAPAPLLPRLHYVTGTGDSTANTAIRAVDVDLTLLTDWVPLHVSAYQGFRAIHDSFLVYDPPHDADTLPLIPRLLKDRWKVSLEGRDEFGDLFLAENPGSPAPQPAP